MTALSQLRANKKPQASRKAQRGLSLIELMLSLALGVFFGSVALTFIASSGAAATTQDVGTRIQENGRFASDEITAMVRMAGYYNPAVPTSVIPQGQFYLGACGAWDPCTADGAGSNPDRIAVLINPTPDDGTDQDCTGTVVNANAALAASSVVANVYFIGDDENGVSSLQCQGYLVDTNNVATLISDPQVLVSGVDNLQVQYGVSNISTAGQVDTQAQRYLGATSVSALAAPTGATTPWVDIKSVQFALLVNSGLEDETSDNANQSYTLLDAADDDYNDSLLRQIFTGTVLVNNARS